MCLHVCARAQRNSPHTGMGGRNKLAPSGPPGTSMVNSDHFRPEQKASVFTIKPMFMGEAGEQGDMVLSLHPGISACM